VEVLGEEEEEKGIDGTETFAGELEFEGVEMIP